VEAFDLAVGLGSVGASLLRGDAELCAGIAPGGGSVSGTVVERTRSTRTPRAANQDTARRRTPIAVTAFSSSWISA
jgi:hypothetical protein